MLFNWGNVAVSTTVRQFEQQALTSNGVLGGNTFAVDASSSRDNSYQPYCAFSLQAGDRYHAWCAGGNPPQWITFYNPVPLNVTSITWGANGSGNSYCPKAFTIQGSNDNSNWDILFTGTGEHPSGQDRTSNLSDNTKYYKYYRVYVTDQTGSGYVYMSYIRFTATYQTTALNTITFPMSFTSTNYYCNIGFTGGFGNTYIDTKNVNGVDLQTNVSSATNANYIAIGY